MDDLPTRRPTDPPIHGPHHVIYDDGTVRTIYNTPKRPPRLRLHRPRWRMLTRGERWLLLAAGTAVALADHQALRWALTGGWITALLVARCEWRCWRTRHILFTARQTGVYWFEVGHKPRLLTPQEVLALPAEQPDGVCVMRMEAGQTIPR